LSSHKIGKQKTSIKVWKGALTSQTQLSPMTHFEKTPNQMKQIQCQNCYNKEEKEKGFFATIQRNNGFSINQLQSNSREKRM